MRKQGKNITPLGKVEAEKTPIEDLRQEAIMEAIDRIGYNKPVRLRAIVNKIGKISSDVIMKSSDKAIRASLMKFISDTTAPSFTATDVAYMADYLFPITQYGFNKIKHEKNPMSNAWSLEDVELTFHWDRKTGGTHGFVYVKCDCDAVRALVLRRLYQHVIISNGHLKKAKGLVEKGLDKGVMIEGQEFPLQAVLSFAGFCAHYGVFEDEAAG